MSRTPVPVAEKEDWRDLKGPMKPRAAKARKVKFYIKRDWGPISDIPAKGGGVQIHNSDPGKQDCCPSGNHVAFSVSEYI